MLAFGLFFFSIKVPKSVCLCKKYLSPRISAKSTQVHIINYEISDHNETAPAPNFTQCKL